MKAAVQDAFLQLIKKKPSTKVRKSKRNIENEGLKQRLAKEQRKKSVGSGSSGAEDSAPKSYDVKSDLDDAISQRRKQKIERMGSSSM